MNDNRRADEVHGRLQQRMFDLTMWDLKKKLKIQLVIEGDDIRSCLYTGLDNNTKYLNELLYTDVLININIICNFPIT